MRFHELPRNSQLLDALVAANFLNADIQLLIESFNQRYEMGYFGSIIESHLLSEMELGKMIASHLSARFVSDDESDFFDTESEIHPSWNYSLAKKYMALPYAREVSGEKLSRLAVVDPWVEGLRQELQTKELNDDFELFVLPASLMKQVLCKCFDIREQLKGGRS